MTNAIKICDAFLLHCINHTLRLWITGYCFYS